MTDRPAGGRGAGSVRVLAGALAVFVLVTADVLAGGPLSRFDRTLSDWALDTGIPGEGWRRPWQREADQLVNFGDREVAGLVVLLALAVLCWRGRTVVPFARLAVLAAAALAIVLSMKVGIARPAPSGVSPDAALRSYPSGHTATAVVVWGVLASVTAEHPGRGVSAGVAWVLSWLAPLLTMVGMVLRDYHWLTDLVGAAALGVVLVHAERLALAHWRRARGSGGAGGGGPGRAALVAGRGRRPG